MTKPNEVHNRKADEALIVMQEDVKHLARATAELLRAVKGGDGVTGMVTELALLSQTVKTIKDKLAKSEEKIEKIPGLEKSNNNIWRILYLISSAVIAGAIGMLWKGFA